MQSPVIPSPKSGRELVDEYFIENRTRVLEVAAFLDRLDRAGDGQAGRDFRVRAFLDRLDRASDGQGGASRDFRVRAFREALDVLTAGAARDAASRVQQIQMIFSDPTVEPLAQLDQKSARGAYDRWQNAPPSGAAPAGREG